MNKRCKWPPQPHGQQYSPEKHSGRPQGPGVLQPKSVGAPQMRRPPAAPPAYRPQPLPKVLQRKVANAPQPRAPQSKGGLAAPPVYRPQPTLRCLQLKQAVAPPPVLVARNTNRPAPPPPYRPQPVPKCLQRKAVQPGSQLPAGRESVRAPVGLHRPQPLTRGTFRSTPSGGGPRPNRLSSARPPSTIQPLIARVSQVGPLNPSQKDMEKYDLEIQVLVREVDQMVEALQHTYPNERVIDLYKPPSDETALNNPGEPLRIVSHGGPGRLNQEPPERIAKLILDAGIFKSARDVNLHTCLAGKKTNGRNFAQKLGDALSQKVSGEFTVRAPAEQYSLSLEGNEHVAERLYANDEDLIPTDAFNKIFPELHTILLKLIAVKGLDELAAFVGVAKQHDKGGYINLNNAEKSINEKDVISLRIALADCIKRSDYIAALSILYVAALKTIAPKGTLQRLALKTLVKHYTMTAFNIKKSERMPDEEATEALGTFRFKDGEQGAKEWRTDLDWAYSPK